METTAQSGLLIIDDIDLTRHQPQYTVLPHPTFGPQVFLLCNASIYELQSVQPRRHGSWFVNQKVVSSGSFLMANKIDPRFLILPFLLEKASQKYSPLDQIIPPSNNCNRIPLEHASSWKLHEVCDVNDKLGDDMILYRWNADKVLSWLRGKVDRTAATLAIERRKQEIKDNALHASSFNPSAQAIVIQQPLNQGVEAEDVHNALGIICEYLTSSLTDVLLTSYNVEARVLTAKAAPTKRKADWEQSLELEKETVTMYNTAPKATLAAKPSAASKKPNNKSNSKVSEKGVKSITSFFAAKK